MIILGCETSTLLGSVAVYKDGQILGYREQARQGSHSDILNVFISDCLDQAGLKLTDIDCFTSGLGPGSFTGIRISLNTIKTLAYAFNKPVIGIDSLSTMAYQFAQNYFESHTDQQKILVAPLINAYKNMVYYAKFEISRDLEMTALIEPSVIRLQNLDSILSDNLFIFGDGYVDYQKYIDEKYGNKFLSYKTVDYNPNAKSLCYLSAKSANFDQKMHWSKLVPIYVRASEAEENLSGIKYQAL